jgi:hypothetical protein
MPAPPPFFVVSAQAAIMLAATPAEAQAATPAEAPSRTVRVQDCVDAYCQWRVPEDARKETCPRKCGGGEPTECRLKYVFNKLPQVLVMEIVRTQWDAAGEVAFKYTEPVQVRAADIMGISCMRFELRC